MGIIRKLLDRVFYTTRPSPTDGPQSRDGDGYFRLPGTRQWSPGARISVDKSRWKSCEHCGRSIPVELGVQLTSDGRIEENGTWTYVCPFCSHCHVGTSLDEDMKKQEVCHECQAKLGDAMQCPNCSFPRGWMRVECPYCKNRQPVLAPHWDARCDMFRLECVQCESVFLSLCVC